jgi:uncharacterized membrane protein YfcA
LTPGATGGDLDPTQALVLAGSGLLAGVLNTLAGGGSLLTLPALLFAGLDAASANATNRIAILLQSVAATHAFRRAGRLPGRALLALAGPTLLGAAAGALLASALPSEVLEPVLLAILPLMAALLLVRPEALAPPEGAAPERPALRHHLALLGAGLYAGFVQAGVGFLFLATLAGGLRYDLVRANALKVALILLLTPLAIGVFAAGDLLLWAPGLVLGAASATGAVVSVRFAVRHPAWLRWVVLAIVLVSTIALVLR